MTEALTDEQQYLEVIRGPKNRWLTLGVFMLAHAVNDGFGWIIPPLLPFIRVHFHLSYGEMGSLFAMFRFTGSIMQAPVSYLVHLLPASAIMAGGLLWCSLGLFLAGFSTSYFYLLWITAVSGLGRSTYHPLALSILSRIFGRDTLGRVVGLHLSGSGIGMVAAPLLVGFLLTRFSWRLPLQVWSAMGLLAGLGLVFFLRHNQQAVSPPRRRLRWPFVSRPLVIYLVSATIWGIAQGGIMAFMALFLVDQRGFQPGTAAAVYGLMSLASLLCRPFLGGLMDRMGRRKPLIIAGYLISSFSMVGLVLVSWRWLIYGGLLLLGVFAVGHSGLADTFMIEAIPSDRREETLGFVYTLRMGIASLAPLLIGFLSEWITIQGAFLALAVMPIAAALLLAQAEENPQE